MIIHPAIPATGGSYILWLKLKRKRRLNIGRLGEHLLAPGYYAYCGSAFGPGGLKARIGHHLKKAGRPHWHIDYLKNITPVSEVWFSTEPANLEHHWSESLAQWPSACIPVPAFGASDCRCPTHLLYFSEQPDLSLLRNLMPEATISGAIL